MKLPSLVALLALLVTASLASGADAPAPLPAPITPPPGERPVEIQVGAQLADITAVNEIDATFNAELELVGTWRDPRLAYIPAAGEEVPRVYVGQEAQTLRERIWKPYVAVVNAVGQPQEVDSELTLYPDGRVQFQVRMTTALRAALDFRKFPFDDQVLPVRFEPFAWNAEKVRLVPWPEQTGFEATFDLDEWDVTGIKWIETEAERLGERGRFSRLTLAVTVQRELGFYIWKAFLPLIAIVLITFVVFWMSDDFLGRRAGVSATGLLTVIAYQFVITGSLPRIPYLTAIDRTLLLSIVIIAGTMVVNVLGDQLERRRAGTKARLDRACRWAFPAVYFGFLTLFAFRHV